MIDNFFKMKKINKKAQIWVETVIYTLIGLGIMAMILTVITPKIKQINDKSTLEQTITLLNDLNTKINAVQVSAGNVREFGIRIKKGELTIDPEKESIYYVMPETKLLFSEVGIPVNYGNINITTTETNKKTYNIRLDLNYNPNIINMTFNSKESKKVLSSAPTEYTLLIKNNGTIDNKININIESI